MTTDITSRLGRHYQACFRAHGATARGVDWRDQETAEVRYERMLAVIDPQAAGTPSLLDVGCGYGGLLDYARGRRRAIDYTGIDVVAEMIADAGGRFPDARFVCGDVMTEYAGPSFDYVVCNGVLTQKLDASIREMDAHANRLVRHLFAIARRGIVFNMMTSFVNFTAPNLFYKSPLETLAFCLSELSTQVRLDHAYGMYEYCVYVYRDA